MNAIRVWAISFCAGCLFLSVLGFLLPNRRFKRFLKPVFASFLILLLLQLTANKKDMKMEFPKRNESAVESSNSFAKEAIVNSAAESVKSQIGGLLEKKDIKHRQIEISMHISQDNDIVINEVIIEGVSAAQRNLCHDLLKKNLGLEVILR